MKAIETKLRGVQFEDCQDNIKCFANPEELGIDEYDLIREPNNPHDENAVWVGIGKIKMGYLPRTLARKIAPLLKEGQNLVALFVSQNMSPHHDTVGLTIRIAEKEQ